jgi:hypothetical protein
MRTRKTLPVFGLVVVARQHTLPDEIGVWGPAATHAAPRAARELPRRLCGTADDRRDLLERHREHVVQDEGEPFRRRQPVEHDEQCEPDRIREESGSATTTSSREDSNVRYLGSQETEDASARKSVRRRQVLGR